MSESILITGGAGYIGSQIAWQCVQRGYNVTIVDNLSTGSRRNLPASAIFHEIDIGDRPALSAILFELRPSAVFHFAGSISVPKSFETPTAYYINNVNNSIDLIDICVRNEVSSFIFSSTAAVYGPSSTMMVDEAVPLAPSSPYGRSKVMVEDVLRDVAAASRLRIGILRYFNVAGADPMNRCGQRSPASQNLIKVGARVAIGEEAYLPLYGTDYDTPDGTCIRDFIHVYDLASAHLSALDLIKSQKVDLVLNCGYGAAHSVLDVVASFERVLGRSLPIKRMPRRRGDVPALIADSTRLRSFAAWQPRFADLDAIVNSSLNWERFLRDDAASGVPK